jgi:hypothetical protein
VVERSETTTLCPSDWWFRDAGFAGSSTSGIAGSSTSGIAGSSTSGLGGMGRAHAAGDRRSAIVRTASAIATAVGSAPPGDGTWSVT